MRHGLRLIGLISVVCLLGCPAEEEGPVGDDDAGADDDATADDDDTGDDDDTTADDDDSGGGGGELADYPADDVAAALSAGAGVCHDEGAPWGYAYNLGMMSISWASLDGQGVEEVTQALGAYIDGVGTPTMLMVQLGGQTDTDPAQPFYPLEKETLDGYLLNQGTSSVTPDLACEAFQADLDAFLPVFGQGLRAALEVPSRRGRVIAVVGWLGSYSESHYSSAGEPSRTDLATTIAKFHTHVGRAAEVPVVFHITGRHDIAEIVWEDPDLLDAVGRHHLWFKINGFHCAEPEAGDCLGEDYAATQADVLTELRLLGANVGWEPKHPEHFLEASPAAQSTGIGLSVGAGACFACSQSPEMIGVMDGLITGPFLAPEVW